MWPRQWKLLLQQLRFWLRSPLPKNPQIPNFRIGSNRNSVFFRFFPIFEFAFFSSFFFQKKVKTLIKRKERNYVSDSGFSLSAFLSSGVTLFSRGPSLSLTHSLSLSYLCLSQLFHFSISLIHSHYHNLFVSIP